jgi:nucleoside-diphosphate-sugar epimerase
MKKILITGASGFIGSFLVEEAIKRNYEVYAGIRNTSKITYLKDSRIQFFKADLADKEAIKSNLTQFGKFDFIIHNAGITKTCKKSDFEKVNFHYTKNLIEALYETNNIPDKFIQISSLAAYGPGNKKTLKPIQLTDMPKPISLYGKSKLKTEQYIESLKGFPYLIFRPTGVYGPREKDYYVMYKSIKQGLETYIGTSKQQITFIYVKDLSKLVIGALESNITCKSYFVSDLKEYTAYEFNWLIKRVLDKKTITLVLPIFLVKLIAYLSEKISCFLFGKIPTLNTEKIKEISQKNWLCNSSDLVKDFNFQPEYDLGKGVSEAIEWYKMEGLL